MFIYCLIDGLTCPVLLYKLHLYFLYVSVYCRSLVSCWYAWLIVLYVFLLTGAVAAFPLHHIAASAAHCHHCLLSPSLLISDFIGSRSFPSLPLYSYIVRDSATSVVRPTDYFNCRFASALSFFTQSVLIAHYQLCG